jgi:hypothetical protein
MSSPWLSEFVVEQLKRENGTAAAGLGSPSSAFSPLKSSSATSQKQQHNSIPSRLVQIVDRDGDWWGSMENRNAGVLLCSNLDASLTVTDGRHTIKLEFTLNARQRIWDSIKHKQPMYRFQEYSRGTIGQLLGGGCGNGNGSGTTTSGSRGQSNCRSYRLKVVQPKQQRQRGRQEQPNNNSEVLLLSLEVDGYVPRPAFATFMAAGGTTQRVEDDLSVRYAIRDYCHRIQQQQHPTPPLPSPTHEQELPPGATRVNHLYGGYTITYACGTSIRYAAPKDRHRGPPPKIIDLEECLRDGTIDDVYAEVMRMNDKQTTLRKREKEEEEKLLRQRKNAEDDEGFESESSTAGVDDANKKTIDDMLVSQTQEDEADEDEEGEQRMETQPPYSGAAADDDDGGGGMNNLHQGEEEDEKEPSPMMQTQPEYGQNQPDGEEEEENDNQMLCTQPSDGHDDDDNINHSKRNITRGSGSSNPTTSSGSESAGSEGYYSAREFLPDSATGGEADLSEVETMASFSGPRRDDGEDDHGRDDDPSALWRQERYRLQLSPLQEQTAADDDEEEAGEDEDVGDDGNLRYGGIVRTSGEAAPGKMAARTGKASMQLDDTRDSIGGRAANVAEGKGTGIQDEADKPVRSLQVAPAAPAFGNESSEQERKRGNPTSNVAGKKMKAKRRKKSKTPHRSDTTTDRKVISNADGSHNATLGGDDLQPPTRRPTVWGSVMRQFEYYDSLDPQQTPPPLLVFDANWQPPLPSNQNRDTGPTSPQRQERNHGSSNQPSPSHGSTHSYSRTPHHSSAEYARRYGLSRWLAKNTVKNPSARKK